MRYFFDQEFIEGFRKPLFGKRRHFIDLISIGIVSEDGREFYAISKDFNPNDASSWVKQNVLKKIIVDYIKRHKGEARNRILDILGGKSTAYCIRHIQHWIGKSNKEIAGEIMHFINPDLGWPVESYNLSETNNSNHPISKYFDKHNVTVIDGRYWAQPTFYAWFADYDWVLFCSLFGTMMDLPPGFSMYCRDLHQTFEELVDMEVEKAWPQAFESASDLRTRVESRLKKLNDPVNGLSYPSREDLNEHHALEDAKWNKKYYDFLQAVKRRNSQVYEKSL